MEFYFLHVLVWLSKYIDGIAISNKDKKMMLLSSSLTNNEYLIMSLLGLFIESCERNAHIELC